MRNIKKPFASKQSGAILVVALLMLLAVSVLTITATRSSKIGLFMAQNDESKLVAEQQAQALSDFIIANATSTPVVGGAGFTICSAGVANCDDNGLIVNNATLNTAIANNELTARVERMNPAFRPPPRAVGSSIDKFTSASFRVTSTYDRSDEALGRERVVEGVTVLIPAF